MQSEVLKLRTVESVRLERAVPGSRPKGAPSVEHLAQQGQQRLWPFKKAFAKKHEPPQQKHKAQGKEACGAFAERRSGPGIGPPGIGLLRLRLLRLWRRCPSSREAHGKARGSRCTGPLLGSLSRPRIDDLQTADTHVMQMRKVCDGVRSANQVLPRTVARSP